AAKNAEEKKWRLAYDGWNQATDPVQELGFWHEIVKGSTHPTLQSWQQTSAAWFYHLSKELREEAKRICLAVTEKHQNGAKLVESIQKFSAALATAPTADPGTGSNFSGPQALEYFGNLWIQQQRNAMRARGHAAILELLGSRGATKPVVAEHADFSTKIAPALAGLIQADAQRASAEDAPALYMQYLEQIPPLVTRGNTAGLVELFQPGLDQLAARSAELQAETQTYTASTADLLRWRRRTVAAYVRVHAESYPSLESVVNENCKERSEKSLLVREPSGQVRALLAKPIPELVEEAQATFMDKAVSVLDLRYRDNYVIGVTDVRSIAYVPTSAGVTQSARESLADDLFAASGFKPMSLAAAVAFYASETGDCSSAGGDIYHIGLSTVAARYTSQTEDDRGLVRLGAFRPQPMAWKTEDLTLMFALKPSWFAHEYYFIKLPQ
ncbi:MAG: hypothetical protein OES79_03540, partial [Planctomycetota bacterium]|nr:hypothetical protein [Planctomycetota bacterium]